MMHQSVQSPPNLSQVSGKILKLIYAVLEKNPHKIVREI